MISTTVPARLLALLLVLAACPAQAVEPAPTPKPSIAEQAKAVGAQVKQDAIAVGTAVKKEAKKVGAATRKQVAIIKTKVKAQTGKADEPEYK